MAAAIALAVIGAIVALLCGYQLGLISAGSRKAHLKQARKNQRTLQDGLDKLDSLARDNLHLSVVLPDDILKIVRNTRNELEN